jgi:hypothetical protein
MVGQMIDLETIDLEIERNVQKYQQDYNLSDADLAWILLRLGTRYYFKDISSRDINGGRQGGHSRQTASIQSH